MDLQESIRCTDYYWGENYDGKICMYRRCCDADTVSGGICARCSIRHRRRSKSLLDKAVAAVKADRTKALDMFNEGEGGFKDPDLYVFCANASDGIVTAHPTMKGEQLRDILGKKGFPLGQEMMQKATEGMIKEVTYWWPRPGSDKPLEKTSFYTKVGDQICGVGYYK